jgi:4'-phosphopantetheinyl transferase
LGNKLIDNHKEWSVYGGQNLSVIQATHIFYLGADQYTSEFEYAAVLSPGELTKADHFFQPADRDNYLLRKYALRQILSRFLQIPADEIRFHQQENKKPAIYHLQFNTSHTNNGIVIAVSESPIGIDIEYINPFFQYDDLLQHCFSDTEQEFILNGADQLLNFYTLWTRKEALLKATGQGMVDHLYEINALVESFELDYKKLELKTFKKDSNIITAASSISQTKELKLWDWKVLKHLFPL